MPGLRLEYQDLRVASLAAPTGQLDGGDVLMLGCGPLPPESAAGPAFTAAQGPVAQAVRTVGPRLYMDSQLRVLASLAGQDPVEAAGAVAASLVETGNADLRVAVVRGQNVLDRLEELMLHTDLAHQTTGQRFAELNAKTVSAIAGLGPRPAAQALKQGARLVLTAYENPTALAEAAAWNAFAKPECAVARGVGGVLACFSRGLCAHSLQQTDWSQLESLQAEIEPNGAVCFYGAKPLCDAAKQAMAEWEEAGRPSPSPTTHSELNLMYVAGYEAELCVALRHEHSASRLRSALSKAPPVVQACRDGDDWPELAGSLAVIPLRHASRDRLAAAVGALAAVLEVGGPELGVEVVGGPPAVRPSLKLWPTQLPPELLEWSIDIKPAAEWLN
ncbi:hypothetical protein Pla123a_25260 [Posidoniimonas polymericola]|uniref:Acyclic terpene utilisation N-terminal domain-containing protein n=1 Tax=Posidoniimonas polymericola TaxID=2528002 RepID=A0A5C5YQB0_9BACT|nr:acyclic terpene utilization AtuA family protein [Posidoniimonas polymericola]TWT77096.1 hypothetical protein Pla123a_25260 [Posidoniimonas polymericola]